VIPGKTGELFHTQSVDSLAQAMENFDADAYKPSEIRAFAEQFDRTIFEREINSYIEQAYDAFQQRHPFVWERPTS
jgi:hypothetical protein